MKTILAAVAVATIMFASASAHAKLASNGLWENGINLGNGMSTNGINLGNGTSYQGTQINESEASRLGSAALVGVELAR